MPASTSLRLKCFVKIQKVYYKKIENISCFVNWNYHGEKFATWRGFNEIIKVLQIFVLSFYIFYLSLSNYKLQLDYFIIIIYYSKNWLFRCFILPNRPYALATLTAWKCQNTDQKKLLIWTFFTQWLWILLLIHEASLHMYIIFATANFVFAKFQNHFYS